MAEAIAPEPRTKDANGLDQPSPNTWQALYILGQIHDARRNPAKAVEYYKRSRRPLRRTHAERRACSDPARILEAARGLDRPAQRGRPGRRVAQPVKPGVSLDYRNIAEVDVKVYPVTT